MQLGRSPTIPELAKAAGVDGGGGARGARVRPRVLVALALVGAAAATARTISTRSSRSATEEHQYEVSEDRAVLAPGFRALDERERKILQLRFFDGLTQSQIAQQVGISQMHVSRLIRRSLEKIRDEIASDERAERRARPLSSERREAEVEQALRVAVHVGRVEHDRDERDAVARRRRDEARAGLVRVPGLDAVRAGIRARAGGCCSRRSSRTSAPTSGTCFTRVLTIVRKRALRIATRVSAARSHALE